MSKLTIEDMQEIAKARGGICLSTEYVNNKTKLEWQFSRGHIWKQRPDMIKNDNNWCPICSRKNSKNKKSI